MALQEIKRREEASCGLTVRLPLFPLYGLCSPGGFLLSPWGDSEPLCVDGCLHPSSHQKCPLAVSSWIRANGEEGRSWESRSGWVTFLSPNLCPAGGTRLVLEPPQGAQDRADRLGSHAGPLASIRPSEPKLGHLSSLFFTKQCLLNAYYVPGAALRAFGTPVRETDKHTSLASWSLCLKFLFY